MPAVITVLAGAWAIGTTSARRGWDRMNVVLATTHVAPFALLIAARTVARYSSVLLPAVIMLVVRIGAVITAAARKRWANLPLPSPGCRAIRPLLPLL